MQFLEMVHVSENYVEEFKCIFKMAYNSINIIKMIYE